MKAESIITHDAKIHKKHTRTQHQKNRLSYSSTVKKTILKHNFETQSTADIGQP